MANTTVDTLLVRIETDLTGLKRGLDQVQRNVATAGDKSADAFRSMEGGINRATGAAAKLGGAILAAVGTAALGGSILGTIRQFEDLEAQLKSVTPDLETAGAAFQLIQKFAATTPFQLQEVTQAFITLASAGIAPTSDVLQDLGNLAAARGKNIQDVAQAVLNATTGEFEMLKSLGIVVRTEGDNITATFNGVSKTMQKSGIVDYLREIGRERFGDALANQSKTLTGTISNLGDAIARFQVAMGKAGLQKAFMDLFGTLLNVTEQGDGLAVTLGRTLAGAVNVLNSILKLMRDYLDEIIRAVVVFLAVFTVSKIIAIAGALITLAKNLRSVTEAMKALNDVAKKSPVLIIATILALAATQMEVLDRVMKSVTDRFKDTSEAAKDTEKNIDELNDVITKKLGGTKAEQSTKKFTDAINDMKSRIAAARLEMQGFTKEEIAVAKAGGALENIDLGQALIGPRFNFKEAEDFIFWTTKLQRTTADLALKNIGDELTRLGREVGTSDLDREFNALFSPELLAAIQRFGISIEGLRERFMGLKYTQAVADFNESMRQMRLEMELTDVERFVDQQTSNMALLVNPQALARMREEAAVLFERRRLFDQNKQQVSSGIDVARQFAGEELRVAEALTAVNAAYEAKKISTVDYLNATKALQGQLKMMNPIFQSIESVVQSATASMTSALVSMFTGAEKAKDAFRNFFGGLANMILSEVMKMLIVVPIMNAIRAALGMPMVPQITPAMADSVQFGSNMYSMNQPGATAGFRQRAGGGAIMAGMPTLVGERGPELFVPHSAGKIVNGNNTASLMRQSPPVVVNQTVQVTTGVQNTVRAEIQNLLPQIADVTKAAVAQSAMRGGSFRRAFA
jgi:hypothetical protein